MASANMGSQGFTSKSFQELMILLKTALLCPVKYGSTVFLPGSSNLEDPTISRTISLCKLQGIPDELTNCYVIKQIAFHFEIVIQCLLSSAVFVAFLDPGFWIINFILTQSPVSRYLYFYDEQVRAVSLNPHRNEVESDTAFLERSCIAFNVVIQDALEGFIDIIFDVSDIKPTTSPFLYLDPCSWLSPTPKYIMPFRSLFKQAQINFFAFSIIFQGRESVWAFTSDLNSISLFSSTPKTDPFS